MAKYREVHSLSAVDAAYVACLVDGEGTTALSRKHANEGRQLVISISSTERPLLDFARGRIGAGKITSKRIAKAHHAPAFTYSIGNRQHSRFCCNPCLAFVPTSADGSLTSPAEQRAEHAANQRAPGLRADRARRAVRHRFDESG